MTDDHSVKDAAASKSERLSMDDLQYKAHHDSK